MFGTVALGQGASDDVSSQIEALNEKYAALPSTSDPETLQERAAAYEKEFSQIGGEAPNGTTSLTPDDYKDHAVAAGIHDVNESQPGYELTNLWSGTVDGDTVVVAAGVRIDESDQGGVLVYTSAGLSPFVPTPQAVGSVRIVAVSGTKLTLAAVEGSEEFVFDMTKDEFLD